MRRAWLTWGYIGFTWVPLQEVIGVIGAKSGFLLKRYRVSHRSLVRFVGGRMENKMEATIVFRAYWCLRGVRE